MPHQVIWCVFLDQSCEEESLLVVMILKQPFVFKVVRKSSCIPALAIGREGLAAVEEQEVHGLGVPGGSRLHQGCIATDCLGVYELAYELLPLIILEGDLNKHHV